MCTKRVKFKIYIFSDFLEHDKQNPLKTCFCEQLMTDLTTSGEEMR